MPKSRQWWRVASAAHYALLALCVVAVILALVGERTGANVAAAVGIGFGAIMLGTGAVAIRLRRAERNRIPDLEDLGRYFDNRNR